MTPKEFVRERPCLDEVEGFKFGLRCLGLTKTVDQMQPLYDWERQLRDGKDIPNERACRDPQRKWEYRKKRKPTPRRPVVTQQKEDDIDVIE